MLNALFHRIRTILAVAFLVSTGTAPCSAIARVLAKTAVSTTLALFLVGSTMVMPITTAGNNDMEVSTHLGSGFGLGTSPAGLPPTASALLVATIGTMPPCSTVSVTWMGQEVEVTIGEPSECWSNCHSHYTDLVNNGKTTMANARIYFPKCVNLCECIEAGAGPCNTH